MTTKKHPRKVQITFLEAMKNPDKYIRVYDCNYCDHYYWSAT